MTTTAPVVPKRSIGFLAGMSMLMLGANVVWTAYNSILLPTLVEKVVSANKALVVGLTGFFGTLLAVLVSILAGIISDHTASRWGKRTPGILIGALVALPVIGLPSLVLSPALGASLLPVALAIVIFSYCGMQFLTNVGNGSWWPLLVDVVPENQRGTASGIQGFLTLVGAAIGILAVASLNEYGHTAAALWLIGGVFALSGLVNALVIRGEDRPADPAQHISLWRAVRDMFKVRTRVAVFFWLVLAVLLANMGINSLQFFARYFFQIYFPAMSPDAAFRTMGGISLVLTMLSAVVSGVLSDRIGRRALILWGMILSAVMTPLMGLTSNFIMFLALAGIRALATGPILSIAPALASDLAPKEEAGQYMAYNNLTTGLSGALASLIFGLILVNMNRATFMLLFVVSAAFFLLGGIVFSARVPQKQLDARLR